MGKAKGEDRSPAPEGGEETDSLTEQVQNLSLGKQEAQESSPPVQAAQPEPSLIASLHARMQLSERVHTAVVQDHTVDGFLVDVVVYDSSEQEPLSYPQSHKHEALIPPNPAQYKDHPRYVLSAVLPWHKFPRAIQHIPLDVRISSSAQFFPVNSVINIYCEKVKLERDTISIKIANRSAPRFVLPSDVRKTLTFHRGPISHYSPYYQGSRPRFLIIVDFEATCDFSPKPIVTAHDMEIIEFPWVVLDTITLDIVYEKRIYVRPDSLDGITNYCTRLTGIKKEDCEGGVPLVQAIAEFDNFIQQTMFPFGVNNFRIVTDSIWDLQVQLRQEAARKRIPLEWWYTSYFDIREEFRHFYAWIPFLRRDPPLYVMLNAFDLPFYGRHHSGLDDCKTIAQVVKVLLQLYPGTFNDPKTIPHNYDPMRDNSWISFMSDCPPDAWLCPKEDCQVYNKPSYITCRFCKTSKP